MPRKQSPFTTLKFCQEVYTEECFCPVLETTKFYNVLHPPTGDFLVAYICDGIEKSQYSDLSQAS